MQANDLKQFRCPQCRSDSLVLDASAEEASEGTISCQSCSAKFPIVGGIPRFVPDDQYAQSFGFQWNRFRRTQLDSHTGLPLSANRLFQVTGWPRDMRGQRVLEAGSGAGRFTEVLLATGATLFSFDLSSAVEANHANNGEAPNLNLFQGSIYDIPLPYACFDKVMCLGVLQHTPEPDRSFACLARHVKPGGELAVDVYARHWPQLISWKYLLRPITTRLPQYFLFRCVETSVKALLPLAIALRKVGGRLGARLMPILEYSHLGLPYQLNIQWSTLDTFDMYSPAHDHPRSVEQVRTWYETIGFVDVVVEPGPNGVIARGRRPVCAT